MIELKNSKTTYLGKASGGDKYSLDAFIGAVQMREPEGQWQDIKSRLVRDADGWHIEGAPYYAEIKDDGSRLFCPDRNERSKYLRLPGVALFSGLSRNVVSNPNKLDTLLLPNQITMPTPWGEIRIIYSNTGMHFEILFWQAPPPDLFGRDSPKILLDAETMGYDIEQLLKSASGIGVPKPRLVPANPEILAGEPQERWLEWNYKNGQLELGFDFGNLPFPILLKNTTVDVQVGASADDGYTTSIGTFDNTGITTLVGQHSSGSIREAFHRFTGITIPQSSTVTTANFTLYEATSDAGVLTKIYADDQNDPTAVTSRADYTGRVLTAQSVDWDGDPGSGAWYSKSIINVIQELVDSYDYSNEAIQIMHKDDGSPAGNQRLSRSYDNTTSPPNTYGAKLHIEYTAGGVTAKTSAETGAGAEVKTSGNPIVIMNKTETGSGLEFLESRNLRQIETGSGLESLESRDLGQIETGSGLESLGSRDLGQTETGSGLESLESRDLRQTETGSGLEFLESRDLRQIETGSGLESLGSRDLGQIETGSGLESLGSRDLGQTEAGSGLDIASLLAAFAGFDIGTGMEAALKVAAFISCDTGLGSELSWMLKEALAGDRGGGYDALKALIKAAGSGSDMRLTIQQGQIARPNKEVDL